MAWNKLPKPVKNLLTLLFWLLIWQLAAYLVEQSVEGRGNELLLPYPVSVLRALGMLCQTSKFWLSVLRSLLRILAGLAAGVLAGVVLAVLTCASNWCQHLLAPAIRVVRATPVTSFILLILLWTGRNNVPIVIAALMVLPVIWENLSQGIKSTDPKLLELAKAYRFSPVKTLALIYIPTVRPYFAAAITTAMGLAWKSGVAAEVICLPRLAIGTQIYNAKLYLEVPELFAWTLVVILLSLVLEKCLSLAMAQGRGGGRR